MPLPVLPPPPRPVRELPGTEEFVPPREVLNELARGFLRVMNASDPKAAARFASQFLTERTGSVESGPVRLRPRTARGPLARAFSDGRMLEPPE
jgi:hypothetical protein